jgi:hypothetical protein
VRFARKRALRAAVKMSGCAMPVGTVERPAAGRLDRDRLACVLGLLGSRHDGEVLAAARAAERMRRAAGLTWREVIEPTPPATAAESSLSVAEMLRLWDEHRDGCLSNWERQFLLSVRRRRHPTPRQFAVIADTAGRLTAGGR